MQHASFFLSFVDSTRVKQFKTVTFFIYQNTFTESQSGALKCI